MKPLNRAQKSLKLSFMLNIFGALMKIMHIKFANEVFVTGLLTAFAVYPIYFYLKKDFEPVHWVRLIFVEISLIVMTYPPLLGLSLMNESYIACTLLWLVSEAYFRFGPGKK